MAGMEKRRSTEPRNTVTIAVTATVDSTFDRRGNGAQVNDKASDIAAQLAHWVHHFTIGIGLTKPSAVYLRSIEYASAPTKRHSGTRSIAHTML